MKLFIFYIKCEHIFSSKYFVKLIIILNVIIQMEFSIKIILKLCLIYVFFNFFVLFVESQVNKGYLYKYNQLYLNPRYSQKGEWKYTNLTTNFICKSNMTDCANHGYCNPTNPSECICDSGYATVPGSYVKCTYEQKSKFTAVFLELLGFGFGHLYAQNISMFIIKLCFFAFSCCNFCINIFVGSANNTNVDEDNYKFAIRSFQVLSPIMIIWYIYDIMAYLNGSYTDDNKMPLA